MGVFRDFFEDLYYKHIRTPIDNIKDKLDDLKIDIDGWWNNTVKSTFEDIARKIPDINDWWNNTVKSTFVGIQKAIPKWEDIRKGFDDLIAKPISKIEEKIPKPEDFTGLFEKVMGSIGSWFFTPFLKKFKEEVALKSLNEDIFQTDEVREAVKKLKEEWKHSPETASELAHSIFDILIGKASKIQLEAATGVKLDDKMKYAKAIFDQIAIITDITLLSAILSEIGEFISMGQIDNIGKEIRAYLDYSGLSQLTGYGYGMILSSVLSPLLTKEIYLKTRPEVIPVTDAIRMFKRGIISKDELYEQLGKQGLSDKLIEYLLNDYKYMPSPSEIISWLAREVFEPKMIEKWRLDEGFEEIKERELFYQQGIDDDMIRKFWIAHWTHPDFYRIKTLVNREKLEREDIDAWCNLVEIAPYWRDHMWELMWDDLTRVDIRRIYELGYRDDEWLRKQLTRIGYKDENLEDMFEFYKRYKLRKYHGILEDLYIEEFKNDLISPNQFYTLMTEIGYTKDEAEALTYLMTIKKGHQTYGELLNSARKMKRAMGIKGAREIKEEIIRDEKRIRELEAQREKAVKEKWGAQALHSLNTAIADLKAKIEKEYERLG